MSSQDLRKRKRASGGQRPCTHCHQPFSLRGVITHEKACAKRVQEQQRDEGFQVELLERLASGA